MKWFKAITTILILICIMVGINWFVISINSIKRGINKPRIDTVLTIRTIRHYRDTDTVILKHLN